MERVLWCLSKEARTCLLHKERREVVEAFCHDDHEVVGGSRSEPGRRAGGSNSVALQSLGTALVRPRGGLWRWGPRFRRRPRPRVGRRHPTTRRSEAGVVPKLEGPALAYALAGPGLRCVGAGSLGRTAGLRPRGCRRGGSRPGLRPGDLPALKGCRVDRCAGARVLDKYLWLDGQEKAGKRSQAVVVREPERVLGKLGLGCGADV